MTPFLSWVRAAGVLTLAAMLLGDVSAQEWESIAAGAKADLQKALAELSEVRGRIEGEKIPLAREVSALEQQLLEQKAALQKSERFQENQLVELNALKTQVKTRGDEVKYLDSLLTEYARAFRTRIHVVEEKRFQPLFQRTDALSGSSELDAAAKVARRGELLKASLTRIQAQVGGELLDVEVLGPSGKMEKGKAAIFGPVAVFASQSSPLVGVVQQELNKADPTVFPLPVAMAEGARRLTASGEGMLGLDSTLGTAVKLMALEQGLFDKLAQGGLVMIPLLMLGAAALLVAIVKWFQFSRIRLTTEADLQTVLGHLEKGEQDKALAHARAIPGPAGELLATAVAHVDEKKEYIEEIVYEKMLGARARLERGLAFLALSATTGPLMGLLGTVMGMIATFKLISGFGSGDPKLLAAGISEALIATATGMAVAIPSLLLHAFLSRKAKGIIGTMEQTAVGFINGVPENLKPNYL